MHPCTALAHSRAIEDAYRNHYANREDSQRGKVAYDAKYAEVRRSIEALPGCSGTDDDVRRGEV